LQYVRRRRWFRTIAADGEFSSSGDESAEEDSTGGVGMKRIGRKKRKPLVINA
jgi:hypothetical protein